MSDNPTKNEVLIKQCLRSILDISVWLSKCKTDYFSTLKRKPLNFVYFILVFNERKM